MSWNNNYQGNYVYRGGYYYSKKHPAMNDISNIVNARHSTHPWVTGPVIYNKTPYDDNSLNELSHAPYPHQLNCEIPNAESSSQTSRITQNTPFVEPTAEHNESNRTKRKPRTVFSRFQLSRMKTAFEGKAYLTSDERRVLSQELGVTCEQIKVWFQNHRSKLKRAGKLLPLEKNENVVIPMNSDISFNSYQTVPIGSGPYYQGYNVNLQNTTMNSGAASNHGFRAFGYPQNTDSNYSNVSYPANDFYMNSVDANNYPVNLGHFLISDIQMNQFTSQPSAPTPNQYTNNAYMSNTQANVSEPLPSTKPSNSSVDANTYRIYPGSGFGRS